MQSAISTLCLDEFRTIFFISRRQRASPDQDTS
jgi:hypothetical protein